MNKAKIKKGAFIASLAALVLVGSTAAFLTSTDIADNWFTVGKVDLDITETFEGGRTLAAGEKITKQPSVKNEGTVNQLFFAEVCVPVMNTTLVGTDGQRIVPDGITNPMSAADYRQNAEIYNLLANTNTSPLSVTHTPADLKFGTISYNSASDTAEGWYYLKQGTSFTVDSDHKLQGFNDGTYNTYLFGYNARVAPNNSTIPIFGELQLRSMVDGDIAGGTIGQVTIRAYTIQADSLEISGLSGNGSTKLYTKTDLEKIYKVCENKENTAQEGN